MTQLTIDALALPHRTKLRLFDIKCAWFDETQFSEFFAHTVLRYRRRYLHHPLLAVFLGRPAERGGGNDANTSTE